MAFIRRSVLLLWLWMPVFHCYSIKIDTFNGKCQQNCHKVSDTKLNIHLIPHSHDDVGWLKTVDQYYTGSHNYIQNAGVQYIISSVVNSLVNNPDRRFIQVETAFFWMWWQRQTLRTQALFRQLVNNGQIEMVNGAWSMNDEATTNYQSIIDQFTWGLRILNDTLGECAAPKIGWQIDPFGHSREQASILAQMGYKGLFFARLDFRDRERRINDSAMEFLWNGSDNLDGLNVFTNVLPDHYGPPPHFCFDILCHDEPIIDDVTNPDYNLHKKIAEFASAVIPYADFYSTNNVPIPMGEDFQYQAADTNFINIDSLIKGFENHPQLNVLYSTPSCYVKAVNEARHQQLKPLEVKRDDFFPYASKRHAFWTGYFTSRPNAKRIERLGNGILQSAKKLISFGRMNGIDFAASLRQLREAMGVMQHHDAITGTAKQAVADDYTRLMVQAIRGVEIAVSNVANYLLKSSMSTTDAPQLQFETCLLANVSICPVTDSDRFVVAIYNPLSRPIHEYVRIPVNDGSYKVIGGVDGNVPNDMFTSFTISKPNIYDGHRKTNEIVFKANNLPPLGLKVYYVERINSIKTRARIPFNGKLYFGTEETGFEIDTNTNRLKLVRMNGKIVHIEQQFLYYESATRYQNSGAYVFRPNPAKPMADGRFYTNITLKIERGDIADEVQQIINEEITQIIRVYKDDSDPYIEFDWIVGNLQVNETSRTGKEIVSRLIVADFDNNGVFFTDSNGRELIRRRLNRRNDYTYNATEEPISSNYYPITSRIVIRDEREGLEVALLCDRSQGGSSLAAGVIEVMLHRRILLDDGFGVSEALNESECGYGVYARGQHQLVVGSSNVPNKLNRKSTAAQHRDLAQRKLTPPLILLARAPDENFSFEQLRKLIKLEYEPVQLNLPPNVNILTLEPWRVETYLIRLEHFFEKNEDKFLSMKATVNLKNIFAGFVVTEIRESRLAANKWLDESSSSQEMDYYRWDTIYNEFNDMIDNSNNSGDVFEVHLYPMQIRTFVIRVKPHSI